ncbi:MAG: HEAT repeat domain-containing protein [Geitlerinemataceae cyanobacterium]
MTNDTLFEQLKHPNPHLRERAMWELVDNRDETTIDRLMSILDEEDTTYRRAAVKALGAIGLDTVPPLLETLQNSDNATVRSSCAKALAQVALNYPEEPFPAEGLQGLRNAIDDPNPVVNIASIMALGEMGTPAFDLLAEALKTTENVAVQVAVANALVSTRDDRASAILEALVEDESADSYVRETATSALSRIEMVRRNTPRNS